MLFFRDEEHIDAWCRAWSMSQGATLTLDSAWKLSQIWFGMPRNRREWRRFTADEIHSIFAGLGLTGEFWSL